MFHGVVFCKILKIRTDNHYKEHIMAEQSQNFKPYTPMQSETEVDAVLRVLSPVPQGVHVTAPSLSEYVPRAQSTQLAPDAYVPLAHATEEEVQDYNLLFI